MLDKLYEYGEFCNGILTVKESFRFEKDRGGVSTCQLVCAFARFEGEVAPKMRIELYAAGQDKPFYESHSYRFGKKGEWQLQSWRVPPMFLPDMRLTVAVNVPDGTVLQLRDFNVQADVPVREWKGGVRFNAHLGFWGLAPDNTMAAYELAAMSGFPACIVNPRVTSDGIFVCLHDDGIDRVARFRDGRVLTPPNYFKDLTYHELKQYEYGSHKNEIYRGEETPLLDDFFALCAKTGMRPVFSTHPGLTADEWQSVRNMLKKYNILKLFHIKSFDIDILDMAYSVFKEEIDGYTYDVGWYVEDTVKKILSLGIDTKKCRLGAEILFDQYTEEIAKEVVEAGLFAAAWDAKRRDFDEYERLISWGVSEFTEDYHCSFGLNF